MFPTGAYTWTLSTDAGTGVWDGRCHRVVGTYERLHRSALRRRPAGWHRLAFDDLYPVWAGGWQPSGDGQLPRTLGRFSGIHRGHAGVAVLPGVVPTPFD